MCDVVIKIGGSLLADVVRLDDTLDALRTLGSARRVLVVPGGGPFADAVRDADRRLHIADSAAHWMAVLAMDQVAHLLVARMRSAAVVTSHDAARDALAAGVIPVLAPYRWLSAVDPLPHSWDVTSDSIAAWVAGACGASHLILVKAANATGALVDAAFDSTRPPAIATTIVTADRVRDAFDQIARAPGSAGEMVNPPVG
jgi:aspartokinase-like uncharacterized kinase